MMWISQSIKICVQSLHFQGHFNNMRVTTYSPDGQNLVTGGEDGKVSYLFLIFYDYDFTLGTLTKLMRLRLIFLYLVVSNWSILLCDIQ